MRTNSSMLRRAIVVALAAIMISPTSIFAAVTTDQEDYSPGSVVTISGDNDGVAVGEEFLDGETIVVDVEGPNGYVAQCSDTFDDGAFTCQITLWNSLLAVGDYSYTARGQTSGNSQSGTFTDNASVDINNKNPNTNSRPTYQTVDGLDLTITGDYICTAGGSGNAKCFSPVGVVVEIRRDDNDTLVVSTPATLNSPSKGDWSATFAFPADANPTDGLFDVIATYTWIVCTGNNPCVETANTASSSLTSNQHFSINNTPADTTKPVITVTKVEGTTEWNGSSSSNVNGYTRPKVYSSGDAVKITWSANENGNYIVTFNACSAENVVTGMNTYGSYVAGSTGTGGIVVSTIEASNFVNDLEYDVRVCMTDSAGLKDDLRLNVVWDETKPDVAITSPIDDAVLLPSEYLAFCAATAEICGTASDETAGLKTAQGVEARIKWNNGIGDRYFDGTDFDSADEVWNDVTSSLNVGAWSLGFNPHTATVGAGNGSIWEGYVSETFVATARAEDKAGNDEETDEVEFTVAKAEVIASYLGDNILVYDPDNPQPLNMRAIVSSDVVDCVEGAEVHFYVDLNFDGDFDDLGEKVNNETVRVAADGSVSATAPITESGVYEVRVEVLESLDCLGVNNDSVSSVVSAGDAANGGGWYQYNPVGGSPRVKFGFTVRKDCGGKGQVACPPAAADIPYKGQFVAINNGKWRLKGTINKYGTTACPTIPDWNGVCGTVSGIGNLFKWIEIDGVFDWYKVADDIAFSAGFRDGGSARRGSFKPDYAGVLTINYFVETTFTSSPMQLKGGGVTLSATESTATTSGSTTTTKKKR